MSEGHVQQRDRAGEHLAVPAVPCGDVLRGCGSCRSERGLQRGVLLQRGERGGERERVRRAYGVQRVELRGVRGSVSGGVVLSCGVGGAEAVWCGGVLRVGGALAGERALRCGVLLQGGGGLERAAERERGGVRGVSGGAVLSCGDGGADRVSAGDVFWDGGEPERVGLQGVCCGVLLPRRGDDERDELPV